MSIYDVYGFVMDVEGPADKVFSEEYGYFKVFKAPHEADLIIKIDESKRPLPTQTWGSNKGIYIPFDENENILWYNKGMEDVRPLDRFLDKIEFLMLWPDKTWLHAGAVLKGDKAYVFTGEGGVGKTSTVLKLLEEGCDYLSDDWLIIGRGKAFPFPKRIHVFDYNLKHKEIAKRVLGHKRLYYVLKCKLLEFGSKSSPHQYMRFLFDKLKERTILTVELKKICPQAKIASPSPISKAFLLERKNVDHIEVKRDTSSKEIARKMAYYSIYEWNHMLKEYYRYVYLFGIRNQRIENRLHRDIKIMNETFAICDLYRVMVPRMCDLSKVDLISILGLD